MAGRGKNQVTLTFAGDSKQLEKTFDRVESASDKMSRKVQNDGSRLFDKLGAGAGAKAATGFGLSFSEKVGPLVAKAPISGPLAALAIGAVPAIAAAITSGILLALGGGVLAAGIIAASKDPKVSAAFSKLADRGKKAFAGFGEPFKAPLIRAADTFGDALERMAPAFMRMGAVIAPLIDILAPAFAEMAEKSLPGIEKAVAASVPLFEKIAEHAPAIGEAISKFFEKIAEGAPSAIKFIDILLKAAEFTLPLLGSSLNTLTKYFLYIYEIWRGVFKGISAGWDGISKAASATKNWVVKTFNSLVSFFGGLPGRAKSAFSGMFDGVKSAFRSALNWVIDRWNNFSIPGINTPFGTIGGFNTPNLPRFHSGGVVPGAPGSEMVAVLQAGERVTPAGRSENFTITVEAGTGGTSAEQKLSEVVLHLIRTGSLRLDVRNNRVVVA